MLGHAGIAGIHIGHNFPAGLRSMLQQITNDLIARSVAKRGHGNLSFW